MAGSAERELLEHGLADLRFPTSSLETLLGLARLLDTWSARQNLTAHLGVAAIVQRLILDAAALARELPNSSSMVDIGSGAGFPGLPIAILFPDRELVSVEARARRIYFQREVVRELGLSNVEVLHGRAEELEPRPADLVIAQAVAAPARAIEWMSRWGLPGGWLAIPLSDSQPDPAPAPGLSDIEIRDYRVPPFGARRRVWLARRPSQTP